jgi:hypothetical protein
LARTHSSSLRGDKAVAMPDESIRFTCLPSKRKFGCTVFIYRHEEGTYLLIKACGHVKEMISLVGFPTKAMLVFLLTLSFKDAGFAGHKSGINLLKAV